MRHAYSCNFLKYLTCFCLLFPVIVFSQNQTDIQSEQPENASTFASEVSIPTAVPVLTPEEAIVENREIVQLIEAELAREKKLLADIEEWQQNSNFSFLKKVLLTLLCAIPCSIAGCFLLKRKKTRKKDLIKAVVSLLCTIPFLLLLFSSAPYFYNWDGFGNLFLGFIIWGVFFHYFDTFFTFSKKDIILLPLLSIGTWGLLSYINPQMRDIPNTIILESDGALNFNGIICNNKMVKARKDFFANYKHISFDKGWIQKGSYHASVKKGKGIITLKIPTELIKKYDLQVSLSPSKANTSGTINTNGVCSTWVLSSKSTLLPLENQYLYPAKKNCSFVFLAICTFGAFLTVLLALRILEAFPIMYCHDKQKALKYLFFFFCLFCFCIHFKEILFVDTGNDVDAFGSFSFPKTFSTWKPAIIGIWWRIAIFISPLESQNASFELCTLISLYAGLFLLGIFLIDCKCKLTPYLIVLACFNMVQTGFYPRLLIDQAVASHCLLGFGLCAISVNINNKIAKKYCILLLVCYLSFMISLIRGESLSCAAPILIVFFALVFFNDKTRIKRIFLSGLTGSIVALVLFCSYKLIISPYVFHEKKPSDLYSTNDNFFREALGVCYFSKDWDDLSEFFNQEAINALDRTQFIERPHDYRMEYLPEMKHKDIVAFWLHMVKKHPLTYLRVKWVGNQVLWRLRPLYSIPEDLKNRNDPTKTGLSLKDFFRDSITTYGIVLPSWVPQISLLFVFLFAGILLFMFDDSLLWIIWGIGASGFLHNFAFFLISGAPNYRYIYWADISGCISFFLSCLVLGKFFEYLRRKHNLKTQEKNNDETVCTDTLFQ